MFFFMSKNHQTAHFVIFTTWNYKLFHSCSYCSFITSMANASSVFAIPLAIKVTGRTTQHGGDGGRRAFSFSNHTHLPLGWFLTCSNWKTKVAAESIFQISLGSTWLLPQRGYCYLLASPLVCSSLFFIHNLVFPLCAHLLPPDWIQIWHQQPWLCLFFNLF